MFPKPSSFKFIEESMKFLTYLFVFVFFGFLTVVPKLKEVFSNADIFVKFLDLITITVPP